MSKQKSNQAVIKSTVMHSFTSDATSEYGFIALEQKLNEVSEPGIEVRLEPKSNIHTEITNMLLFGTNCLKQKLF